jgi:hypothetical protein
MGLTAELPKRPPPAGHVCCDGHGGFVVCWDRAPELEIFYMCKIDHEADHIDWLKKHGKCNQCKGKDEGWHKFEMTESEYFEWECEGWKTEFECLFKNILQAGSHKQEVLKVMNALKSQAPKSFPGCNTDDWGK